MPQIPIVAGSQRIEPASPVAAIGTTDARMGGEAAAGFGNAVFEAGNLLDTVARKAKEATDKLSVTAAVNQARLEMLKIKAAQDAEPIFADDTADGVSGINRYNQKLDPVLSGIEAQLGDPKQRQMFQAEISGDRVSYSTQVLAGEVGKRERNVPIMMMDNINKKAALARQDPKQTGLLMDEVEVDILSNPMIADANKVPQILAAKKQIAREGLFNNVDRGNGGTDSAWNDARQQLDTTYNQIFSSEEKEKLLGEINQQQNGFYTREWQNVQRKNATEDRFAKEQVRDRTSVYMAALSTAGNSDFKRAPILRQIELDPDLDFDPAAKKRLIENRTFMETADDTYQVAIMDRTLRTKNFERALNQIQSDQGVKVSMDRATKLQQALRSMQDTNQKNPYIMKALDQARDELNNYKKPPTFDVVSGMMKQENDTYNEKAQTELMSWAARASIAGNISPGGIDSKLKSLLGTYYGGRSVTKPVQGVSPENLTTSKGIDDTAKQLYIDAKAGKYNTPAKKKELQQKLQNLKENQDAVKAKENATVRTNSSGGSKIFDEE